MFEYFAFIPGTVYQQKKYTKKNNKKELSLSRQIKKRKKKKNKKKELSLRRHIKK